MSEPSIDASILGKALDWMWVGVLGLVSVVYKINEKKHETAAETLRKLDEKVDHEVRCARVEIKSKADREDLRGALRHIETLFSNGEKDRKEARQMIADESHRLSETMRLNQADVMKAIADISGRRH